MLMFWTFKHRNGTDKLGLWRPAGVCTSLSKKLQHRIAKRRGRLFLLSSLINGSSSTEVCRIRSRHNAHRCKQETIECFWVSWKLNSPESRSQNNCEQYVLQNWCLLPVLVESLRKHCKLLKVMVYLLLLAQLPATGQGPPDDVEDTYSFVTYALPLTFVCVNSSRTLKPL